MSGLARAAFDLTTRQVEDASVLGEKTFGRYRKRAGRYPNLRRSHILGKLGEVAVERWLGEEGIDVDPAFRDSKRASEADILIDGFGVEVKTWRPATWDSWGRCVTPEQMPVIDTKASAVVWVVADDEATPVGVEIMGWSTPGDLVDREPILTGPPYRKIRNHQVEVDEIRPLGDLLEEIR